MECWKELALGYLARWHGEHINASDVDRAERWAVEAGSAMLTVPGAWRAKVVNGSLWLKLLLARDTWAERSSVLRMLLLLVSDRRRLPDLDIVYATSDQDPAPSLGYPPCVKPRRPCKQSLSPFACGLRHGSRSCGPQVQEPPSHAARLAGTCLLCGSGTDFNQFC